ncbi:MAG TPA: hypothetical protein VF062_02150 [Candidatus Limnocylindrales bacterium]
MTMLGHERTYRPPRSLRDSVGNEVTAWDLFRLEHDEVAGAWAAATLSSVVASIDAEQLGVLGCTECLDTGFYGVPSSEDPDLLTALVRRVDDAAHEVLQADGTWQEWAPTSALEVLDSDTAGELAGAITAGGAGLLRLYGQPLAFLPPTDSLQAAALISHGGAAPPNIAGNDWKTFAVVHEADPGAVLDLVRFREGETQRYENAAWTPDNEPLLASLPMVQLDDRQLEDVLGQMQPSLVADAPLTVSPDPRAERLRRYWSSGRGAAKIRWNSPSDWKRCYRQLRKYMGERAKGWCQNMHRRNTGMWTGDHRNRGLSGSAADESPVRSRSGHVLRMGDCFEVLGPEATPYSAQVIDLPALRDLADPQLVRQPMDILHAAGGANCEGAVAVLLDRAGPQPVPTKVSGPRVSDQAEVQQALLNRSAMRAQDSPLGVGAILAPTVEEVLRAQAALPDVLTAAVHAALRNNSRGAHRPTAERVAVLLPTAIVSLAQASGNDGPARTLVDHTGGHRFYNTPPVSPEAALLASIRSRRMAGNTEGKPDMPATMLTDGVYTEVDDANDLLLQNLTASTIPVAPPDEWFEDPKLAKVTTLTITDEGRVFGHLAPWGVSHIGMAGSVKAPPNRTGKYAYFRTGQLVTASGKSVRVGQLTVAGGHAPTAPGTSVEAAVKHYDDTASGVADIAVGEDKHGIWAAGALRPNVTPEQVRVMRACPPSGDWRVISGNFELVAACHVNVQGFPIAAAGYHGGAITALVAAGARQMAEQRLVEQADAAMMDRLNHLETMMSNLVASAPPVPTDPPPEPSDPVEPGEPAPDDGEDNPAAAGTQDVEDEEPRFTAAEWERAQRISAARAEIADAKRKALRERVTAAGAVPPQFLAHKKGPDGTKAKSTIKGTDSFPIGNVADLKKAIQAFGRAGDKAAAKKHIISQAYKLKRPDLIPDGWRGGMK